MKSAVRSSWFSLLCSCSVSRSGFKVRRPTSNFEPNLEPDLEHEHEPSRENIRSVNDTFL